MSRSDIKKEKEDYFCLDQVFFNIKKSSCNQKDVNSVNGIRFCMLYRIETNNGDIIAKIKIIEEKGCKINWIY